MSKSRFEASAVAIILSGTSWAQVTQRVSVSSSEAQANGQSYASSISADGRYVAFQSDAANLVPGDTNGVSDVFLRDCQSGTTERVSVSTSGLQGDGASIGASITPDGRYVAFVSYAGNLVVGDTNGTFDVFVRDRQNATTERVSVTTALAQANGDCGPPSISDDGRYVAFHSDATNLVAGDTNVQYDVFVRDRQGGTTERVSLTTAGVQGNGPSTYPSISADGRYVAFESYAYNLVSGDTNATRDVFVRDRQSSTTERVSVSGGGAQGDGESRDAAISGDGRYVAFMSFATNLVPGDTNGKFDVFVRDRQSGTTERASIASGGAQGNGDGYVPSISADGRYVTFYDDATTLVPGDTNGTSDVFLRDRQAGTTERVGVATSGTQGDGSSQYSTISADGRRVAFQSYATNLVSGDTNGAWDIFVRDRDATSFTGLCDPGLAGVIACPCSNPPSGAGRGCNNSSATGGAILAASGVAYLSMDSLVFTTSGEKPTATSVVLQGTSSPAAGVVYGQGVRCVGGTLKRLFTKSAMGGSITAPNFGAGDPTVSARSAAKGDTILSGQSRWYLVFYRDPTVLGGCPASSTFNATPTGRVSWSL